MTSGRRSIRVLHLASFVGNIGDLANHAGSRRLMTEHLPYDLKFTELEIREFYWKKRSFDDAFVDYANTFDLLIIGGGNYFELWVDHSQTGTSIDISPDRLHRLKVPTVFHALGVDIGQGYTEQSAARFRSFMGTVLDRSDMFVSVRNDGSTQALQEVFGSTLATQIPTLPDGGFFVCALPASLSVAYNDCVGVNIAGDMLEKRFDRGLSVDGFLDEMAAACCMLMDTRPSLRLVLMPHIWRDVALIAQLLPRIEDSYLRRRVAVGTLEPTARGLDHFISSYQGFDLVLGMRFHANVCPIGMGIPARGLLNYPQVQRLYEELDMSQRLVDVRDRGFGQHLVESVTADLIDLPAQQSLCQQKAQSLRQQADITMLALGRWLQSNLG
jgi:polysaccharide pyruvyl transferase WcaK-like protein